MLAWQRGHSRLDWPVRHGIAGNRALARCRRLDRPPNTNRTGDQLSRNAVHARASHHPCSGTSSDHRYYPWVRALSWHRDRLRHAVSDDPRLAFGSRPVTSPTKANRRLPNVDRPVFVCPLKRPDIANAIVDHRIRIATGHGSSHPSTTVDSNAGAARRADHIMLWRMGLELAPREARRSARQQSRLDRTWRLCGQIDAIEPLPN